MKKLILSLSFALLCGLSQAQTAVTRDSITKNYYAVSTPKTKEVDKLTGSNFVNSKGEKFPVWESAKGKLYYKRVSAKPQKEYKCYIQTETK